MLHTGLRHQLSSDVGKVATPLNTLMGGARIIATGILWYLYSAIAALVGRWAIGSRSDQLVPMPLTRGGVVGRRADSSFVIGCRRLCGYYPENYPY